MSEIKINHNLLVDMFYYFEILTFEEYLKAYDKGHPKFQLGHKSLLYCYVIDHLLSKKYRIREIFAHENSLKQAAKENEDKHKPQLMEVLRERDEIKRKEQQKQKEFAAQQAKIDEKRRLEQRKAFYQGFELPMTIDGDSWKNCKVADVKEIFPEHVHPDNFNNSETSFQKFNYYRLSGGYKAQEITLESGQTLICNFTKGAEGVVKYNIIDFESKDGVYIERKSLKGHGGTFITRPIEVNVESDDGPVLLQFGSIVEACVTLRPGYSYQTICKKTYNAPQKQIDAAFKGCYWGAVDKGGILVKN